MLEVILKASFSFSDNSVGISALLPRVQCKTVDGNYLRSLACYSNQEDSTNLYNPCDILGNTFYKFDNASVIILLLASQLTSTAHTVPCQISYFVRCQRAD